MKYSVCVVLALLLLATSNIATTQATDAEIHRAAQAALQIKTMLDNPDNFVLDYVRLAPGKNGNDVCYSFHSRSAWDFIGRKRKSNLGEEIKTADLTTKGKLRVIPPQQGAVWRPCSHQERYVMTDITRQVREAGGFTP